MLLLAGFLLVIVSALGFIVSVEVITDPEFRDDDSFLTKMCIVSSLTFILGIVLLCVG